MKKIKASHSFEIGIWKVPMLLDWDAGHPSHPQHTTPLCAYMYIILNMATPLMNNFQPRIILKILTRL